MAQQKQVARNASSEDALVDALVERIIAAARAKVAAEGGEDAPTPAKGRKAKVGRAKATRTTRTKENGFMAYLHSPAHAKRQASNKALAASIRAREFASKREALAVVRKHAKPATLASWEAMVAQAYA